MSDLIDRQAAIDVASFECHEFRGIFGRIEEKLKALPSATIEAEPMQSVTTTWTDGERRDDD